MKKTLLACIALAFSVTGFSQNTDLFALIEVRASDDLEYEQYTYNSDNLLKATDHLFDDGMLVTDSLYYDDANNVIRLDRHQLLNGNWVHVSYIEYTYDENGNKTSRSNYNSFGGPTFTLGGVYNYHYENNVLTDWELLMSGTDLVEIGTLTYNADGQLIAELGQDAWGGPMEDSWKIDYVYNPDGSMKTTSQSFWNGSSWNLAGSEWFFYDDHGNCIEWQHKRGNTVTNKFEYEYDLEYSLDQLVLPFNPEDETETKSLVEHNNMMLLSHWYTENDQGNLIYVCDYIYTYEMIEFMGTQNPGSIASDLMIYPNPASDLVTISGGEMTIKTMDVVDTTGRVVMKNSNVNKKETNLDVSGLSSGVYFVRMLTSKGVVTKKIVVK